MEEEELVTRLRKGDRAALGEAITLHHGFLLAMVRPLAGVQWAEDVVQETWLKATLALPRFEGRSKLRTWLARIAINEAHAIHRKQGREQSLHGWGRDLGSPIASRFDNRGRWVEALEPWNHDTPESIISEAELHHCIRKHLRTLPVDQQTVLMMKELAGLECFEIAQALLLSEGNVRVLLHRGRQRLHTMIENFEETGKC